MTILFCHPQRQPKSGGHADRNNHAVESYRKSEYRKTFWHIVQINSQMRECYRCIAHFLSFLYSHTRKYFGFAEDAASQLLIFSLFARGKSNVRFADA